jgi:hypothetical protein
MNHSFMHSFTCSINHHQCNDDRRLRSGDHSNPLFKPSFCDPSCDLSSTLEVAAAVLREKHLGPRPSLKSARHAAFGKKSNAQTTNGAYLPVQWSRTKRMNE